MDKVRIGLTGAGWIGREHARNLLRNPRARLAAVCDADPAAAQRLKAETGADFRIHSRYEELLKDELDAVVIASPNALHAEMAVAAAAAGKAIYCEKPMAITMADARRVRKAVAEAGVPYLIGYHRRLNPLYRHLHGLVREGRFGSLFMAESDYLHHIPGDWGIWSWLGKEAAAGSLFHAGSGHNVDLLRYFCGEVAEVNCMKGTFLPRADQVETEDTAVALFRFESGAIGKVQFCVGPIVPFQFRLRLYGTKGTALDNRVWFDSMPKFAEPGHEREALVLPESWIPDNVQGGIAEPWGAWMDHFVAMLTEKAACLNDVHSAYGTTAACFAAMEAARLGRTVRVKEMDA